MAWSRLLAHAGDQRQFHQRAFVDHVLDRCGRHVLAMPVLNSSTSCGPVEQAGHQRHLAQVTGAEEAVGREPRPSAQGLLVVAHHGAGRLDQHLAVFVQLALHAREDDAHSPGSFGVLVVVCE